MKNIFFVVSALALSTYAQATTDVIPVAIIGSGPAGLSAALCCARARYSTVVFQGDSPGGQLVETSYIENWPGIEKIGGSDLMEGLEKQAKEWGATCLSESITQVDFSAWPFILTTGSGDIFQALSVIIATGSTPRLLHVPGEEKYFGSGVHTCALCDGPFYQDKEIVVVGGGDTAAEEALQLSAYAKKVTILVRGGRMRALSEMQERITKIPSIETIYNAEIVAIEGDDEHVTGIQIKRDGEQEFMPIDGIFLAIGRVPNSEIFKNHITCNHAGYIQLSGRSQATSVPGVFAAGEVTGHFYAQAGVAAGDGIKAALDATRFLSKQAN